MPGRKTAGGAAGAICAIVTFTGTRCVNFVKLPDALFGGMSENSDAVFAPI